MKSLIENLEHRKGNNWVVPEFREQGPKTIKDIHQEYEKEKEESEKRANDYYDDYSSQRNKRVYYPKEVTQTTTYIQSDEPQKSRDSLAYGNIADIPNKIESVSFKVKRGKKEQDSQSQETKTKIASVNAEELEKLMKELFASLDAANLTAQVTLLHSKAITKDFLNVFFRTFHDAKMDEVKERIPIIKVLLESKAISADEFLQRFTFAMIKGPDYDSPNLPSYMAQIFADYLRTCDKAKLSDVVLPVNVAEDYLIDMIGDFYSAFLKKLQELIRSDADLSSKVDATEIATFEKKLEDFKTINLKKE